ncbi:MAG: hypothetical protein DMG01_00320, partial [Acidobacteria bacterium]
MPTASLTPAVDHRIQGVQERHPDRARHRSPHDAPRRSSRRPHALCARGASPADVPALRLGARLTITRQTALAITALGYAALMGIEGVALYQRKPWARWFTIIATSSLIPIE